MRRALRPLLQAAFLLLLAAGMAYTVSLILVLVVSQQDQRRPVDAIVVLGAAQYNGRPSPVLRARLDHAIDLYDRGYAPLLVLTGGVGEGDTTSEAAVGRRYAYRAGVPEDAILTEEHGRTTTESLYAVSALLHERGATRVILVSDPFHVLRLRVLADRLDLHPMTSPTRTSPISASRQERWSYVVSESVKVPLTFLLGDVADRIIAPDVPPLDSILRR